MAIIKHIPVKNRFYTAAVQYLSCLYDEYTNQPYLDEKGRLIERAEYLIEGYNCDVDTFGAECIEVNRDFGKNNSRRDVKAHHYIISFSPEDNITMDEAMEFGKNWLDVFAPGHQAILAVHPDGHNGSRNMHVHIVFNSVRMLEQKQEPWHEKACEYKRGCKHRSTGRMMRAAKNWVMKQCRLLGLHQVELLRSGKHEEYYVNERLLEKELATGIEQLSDKDVIRDTLDRLVSESESFNDMVKYLRNELNWKVRVTEKTISYQMPGMKRPIRGKRLGSDYDIYGLYARFVMAEIEKKEKAEKVVQELLEKYSVDPEPEEEELYDEPETAYVVESPPAEEYDYEPEEFVSELDEESWESYEADVEEEYEPRYEEHDGLEVSDLCIEETPITEEPEEFVVEEPEKPVIDEAEEWSNRIEAFIGKLKDAYINMVGFQYEMIVSQEKLKSEVSRRNLWTRMKNLPPDLRDLSRSVELSRNAYGKGKDEMIQLFATAEDSFLAFLEENRELIRAEFQRECKELAVSAFGDNFSDFEVSSAEFKCQDEIRAVARDCGIKLFTYDDNPFIHHEDKSRVRIR